MTSEDATTTDNKHFESFGIRQCEKDGFMDEHSQFKLELQRLILDKYQNEPDPTPLPNTNAIHFKPSNVTFETIFQNERDRFMKFVPIIKQKESKDGLRDDGLLYQTTKSICKMLSEIEELPRFVIYLNCTQFLPEELKIRIIDNHIVVSGSHTVKLDEHGLVEREFTNRYPIPDDVDKNSFSSSYNDYGILVIKAERVDIPRVIEIIEEDDF